MTSPRSLKDGLKGVYYGWWVLLSTSLIFFFSGSIFTHSTSIFFFPVKKDLGLNSTQTSLIFALSRVEGGIAGPFVGRLVDKFGSRPMIILGGITASLGFISLHWVNTFWAFALIYVGVVSMGRSIGLTHAILSAVNKWFIRRRSLAMSIQVSGFSLGGALILPLITLGVHTIGWRDVMLYSGVFFLLIVVPLGIVVRHSPESMGIEPEGLNPVDVKSSGVDGTTLDFTVREAMSTRTFWLLTLAVTVRLTLAGAIVVHAVEMMVQEGLDREAAGFMVALMFLVSAPIRVLGGMLGVWFPIQPLLSAGMVAGGFGVISLLLLDGKTAAFLFVILIGIEQGSSALTWVSLGNFYGRKCFTTLLGTMGMFYNVGLLLSPIYAGWIADTHGGSYTVAMISFLPLYAVAALLFLTMQKPALPPQRRSVPTAS